MPDHVWSLGDLASQKALLNRAVPRWFALFALKTATSLPISGWHPVSKLEFSY